jgi:orotate phosphoribosyltransferase
MFDPVGINFLEPPIVIVDDVLTTGENLWKAVEEIGSNNVSVKYIFCIIYSGNERNIMRLSLYALRL